MNMSMLNPIWTLADGWFTRLFFRTPGASDHARNVDFVYLAIWWISIASFILVIAAMLWFTFKYRRRPGVAAERSPSHHTMLELTWSIVPLIIMAWMFFVGFWGYTDAVVAPAESETMQLRAKKWNWSLTYPNGASSLWTTRQRDYGKVLDEFSTEKSKRKALPPTRVEGPQDYPVFVIPAGRPTKFQMISEDVMHSFWVPDFRIKFDVFPNRYTSVWIVPDSFKGESTDDKGRKYDDHWVFCAEYCGDNHSEMLAVLRVMQEPDYRAVLAEYATPTGTLPERGLMVAKSKGCFSCHSTDGSKNTGPSWKDIYGRATEFADGTSDDHLGDAFANYVRESVYEPGKKLVKPFPNQMPTYKGQISEEYISYLVAYMKSISAKGQDAAPSAPAAAPAPAPTPAGKQ